MKRFEFYWCDGTGKRDSNPDLGVTITMTAVGVLDSVLSGLYGGENGHDAELHECYLSDKENVKKFVRTSNVGDVYEDGDFNIKRIK